MGKRPSQQDALCLGEKVNQNVRMYGVFDGHGSLGGGRCSKLAARKLKTFIANGLTEAKCTDAVDTKAVEEVVVKAFQQFDDHLRTLPKIDKEDSLPKKSKFSRLFGKYPRADFDQSGSCGCVVLETEDNYIVANLGDSRAIFSDGSRITSDHTTMSLTEIARLYEAGGWTIQNRLFGALVPTRTFGNFIYKKLGKNGEMALSNKPEVFVIPRNPDMPKFIVIMCDGVHDALKDCEIGKLVQANEALDADEIARTITDKAFARGSKDNISCIVIRTNRSARIPKSSSVSSLEAQTADIDSDASSLSGI